MSFAAISSPEFLKKSSVEIYSLDPDDDSLEFTKPTRDLDAQITKGNFAVFTFTDDQDRVDSSISSAHHDSAVAAVADSPSSGKPLIAGPMQDALTARARQKVRR